MLIPLLMQPRRSAEQAVEVGVEVEVAYPGQVDAVSGEWRELYDTETAQADGAQ